MSKQASVPRAIILHKYMHSNICIQFNGVRPLVMLHRICTNTQSAVVLYHRVSLLDSFTDMCFYRTQVYLPGITWGPINGSGIRTPDVCLLVTFVQT